MLEDHTPIPTNPLTPDPLTPDSQTPAPHEVPPPVTIQQIFLSQGVSVSEEAAEMLAKAFGMYGDKVDARIADRFEALVDQHKLKSIDRFNSERLLCQIYAEVEAVAIVQIKPARVMNVFHDLQRERWDAQEQKNVVDHRLPTLLPEAVDYQNAELERYQKALQRVKNCEKLVWWSDASPIEEKVTVRPVECAMGVRGFQCVVGVLRRFEEKWFLADTLQKIELDFTEYSSNNSVFIESNIVIATGNVDEDSKFRVLDIAHPPPEDNSASALRVSLRQQLLHAQLLGGSGVGRSSGMGDKWIVVGLCHLDVDLIHSKLYQLMSNEDDFSTIVLVGEFLSNQPSSSLKAAFAELIDTLKMCVAKLSGKRVVFIPGRRDPGPQFLPKLRLLPSHIQLPEDLPFEVVLASNPARVESRQLLEHVDGSGDDVVETNLVICRSDVIAELTSAALTTDNPFTLSAHPSSEELQNVIPEFLVGQGHLYPVPFFTPQELKIAVGFDFSLFLSPLPDAVVVVDDQCQFATRWNDQCWFGCPGAIERGEYLVYDLVSDSMQCKTLD